MKLLCLFLVGAFLAIVFSPWWRPLESFANNQDEKAKPKVPDAAALKARLSSVLVRDNEVFAANTEGIFRATAKDKQWIRLPSSKDLPANGSFADTPKDSNHILYFAHTFPSDRPNPNRGLYHSTDGGVTWRLISGDYDFQQVFLHRDGSLYAIVMRTEKTKEGTAYRWSILRAPVVVVPAKWLDITGDIGAGVTLHGIFEDPDHDGLVCLRGNCIRNYVIQAQDKNYRWEMTPETHWDRWRQPETDESFLSQWYYTQSTLFMLSATLPNYFDHPFGSATSLCGLTIRTKEVNYTFAKAAPKVIPVAIHFMQEEDGTHLLDLSEDLDFWGIRVVTPSGERVFRPAKGYALKEDDQKARKGYRDRKDLVSMEVKSGKPYQRSIDLDRLFNFSKAGTYKVLLSYHNTWLADRDKEEWVGGFGGQVFTVTVR
jgi:hypothetical protein